MILGRTGAVQNPETQNPDRPKSRHSKSRNSKSRQVQNPDMSKSRQVKIPTGQNPDKSKSRKIFFWFCHNFFSIFFYLIKGIKIYAHLRTCAPHMIFINLFINVICFLLHTIYFSFCNFTFVSCFFNFLIKIFEYNFSVL